MGCGPAKTASDVYFQFHQLYTPSFLSLPHNPRFAPVRCTCTRRSFLPWMFLVAGTVTDPAVWEELYKKFLGMNYFVKAGVVQE